MIDRPYAQDHLCETHLRETVWDRARRELHRQAPRMRGGVVAVALSGGKDSAAALSITHRYFSRRPTVRLVAISVDEGIRGYRTATLSKASELCRSLGVEHRVLKAQDELGTTTDEAARALPSTIPCSFCGVWRRGLLNKAARSVSADLLVLGFNLDDLAQTVLMNLARGEVDRLLRMSPHRLRQPGLVPRVAPLATVPEREVYAFARAAGLPFDHSECPHANAAERNRFREVVWQARGSPSGDPPRAPEDAGSDRRAPRGRRWVRRPERCTLCGEPSATPVCRSCEYRREAGRGSPGVAA